MSLTLAYTIARDGLSTTSAAASVVSRNIANIDNPNSARKTALIVTDTTGGVHVDAIVNAVDDALMERVLEGSATHSELAVITTGLDRLTTALGEPGDALSPASLIATLASKLQLAAGAPHDEIAAGGTIATARSLTDSLNASSRLVIDVRREADISLREAAGTLSQLLRDFREINASIIAGSAEGRDVTDPIDQRTALLRDISTFVDIRPVVRGNNDMMLFLANGATVFETSPRDVSFDAGGVLAPGQSGGTLRIDGIPVRSGDGIGGRIGGLLRLRDDFAPTVQRQLDEIARGLIVATAESDQSVVATLPDLPGLFTHVGPPFLLGSAVRVDGLAGLIRVNAAVDPAQGGVALRLRDGGISAPTIAAYTYNPSGAAGFGGRLLELIDRLSQDQQVDPTAGLSTSPTSVREFAANSTGWVHRERALAHDSFDTETIRVERALSAWQSRVGTNVDDEMVVLIGLQRSFQASSHLINSINAMFDALLRATE